jgi:hypothetical protein
MTAFVTAFLAVLVFVATQSFLKLVLEPIQEQKRLIGEVAHALLFYANSYYPFRLESVDARTIEELNETRKALRGLSGRLQASLWTVPFYGWLTWLGMVPKKEDVLEAATQLVGWSNSLYGDGKDHVRRRRIIADKLGICKKGLDIF